MRLALVLLLVHGLVPALGEVAETAVHLAVEGHLAHTEADGGDLGEQGDEHGCGTTQHHCDCCTSQVVAQPSAVAVVASAADASRPAPASVALASVHEPGAPFRPPITS